MITKVIVILLICSKLDYTTSLPDIIRIGEDFSRSNNKSNKISVLQRRKSFFMQHRVTRQRESERCRMEQQKH